MENWKAKVEQALTAPGWFRLWITFTIGWGLFALFVGLDDQSLLTFLVVAVSMPTLTFLGGCLLRWVIRGFIQ